MRDGRQNIRGESLSVSPQDVARQSVHSHSRPSLPVRFLNHKKKKAVASRNSKANQKKLAKSLHSSKENLTTHADQVKGTLETMQSPLKKTFTFNRVV